MTGGPIVVVLHVVVARPDHFHRPLRLLREERRLARVVIHETTTEPAA
jgi:hypothetical protein